MSRDIVRLSASMSLREAAHLLVQGQIGGAPVVDEQGRCVGVLSCVDFARLAEKRPDVTRPTCPPLPVTCSFQSKRRIGNDGELILCALPDGVCPMQMVDRDPDGAKMIVGGQPNCVLMDWQVVDMTELPVDEVRRFMTPDPVTVREDDGIRGMARIMLEKHIHRLIVVDADTRPIGIVSTTDLLTALCEY
jgi:CBS domain-containing protein